MSKTTFITSLVGAVFWLVVVPIAYLELLEQEIHRSTNWDVYED